MSDGKIFNINYDNWADKNAARIARNVERDNIRGLSTCEEILAFFSQAKKENVDISNVNELFGLTINKSDSASVRRAKSVDYNKIADAFNSLSETEKEKVIETVNDKGYERLFTLEQDLNIAFENCEGYRLVNAHRDRFESKYAFDFEQVHNDVKTALNSLNKLQKDMEKAYDKAKGKTGTEAKFVDYDTRLKNLAQTKLGMSYEEFVAKYDLEFTKSMTRATALDNNFQQKDVYYRAKEYVDEIKRIAREELQTTRTEYGERLLDETMKYSNSVVKLIDFEYNVISASDIANLESEIMREVFVESVNEATPVNNVKAEDKKPDGKYYDKASNSCYIVKNGIEYNINGTKRQ